MGSVGFSILLGQLLSPDLGLGMASATWGLNFPQASSKNLPWCPQTVGCKAEGLLLRGEGSEGTSPSSPKVPYPPGTSSQWRPFLDKGRSWPCFTARLRVLLFCPKAGRVSLRGCQFGEGKVWAFSNPGGEGGELGAGQGARNFGPEILKTPHAHLNLQSASCVHDPHTYTSAWTAPFTLKQAAPKLPSAHSQRQVPASAVRCILGCISP